MGAIEEVERNDPAVLSGEDEGEALELELNVGEEEGDPSNTLSAHV